MQIDQAGDIAQTEEALDTQMLKRRSIMGALAFTGRTALLQAVGLIAVFLLTVYLSPQEYGVFIIVDAVVGILVYFSDIGLAAALIQKKRPLTPKDLATTFTIQLLMVLVLVVTALGLSEVVTGFYDFGSEGLWLYRALVVAFFLSSLKTIPSIILERELEFNKLVVPQILETLVFYGVAVTMAFQGYGVISFAYAVVFRAIVGLLALYVLKPWMPRLGIDPQVARQLVSFGAPFQFNSILALLKDRLMLVFLGRVLPTAQIGYLGWAEKWAMTPIRFFADPILRVTFPAYSRLQDKKEDLKKAIEKSVFFVSLLVFPSVVGLITIAPSLVSYIPKYQKWEPALLALVFYGINAMFSSISITLTNTLNATGRVGTTLKLMVMWTSLTWILTPGLIYLMGYNGVALASALTASSSMVAYYLVNRIVRINLVSQIIRPLIAALIMGLGVWYLAGQFATSLMTSFVVILSGAVIYAMALFVIAREKIITEVKTVRKHLTGNS